MLHELTFAQAQELLQALKNISEVKPNKPFWALAKNTRRLKDLTDGVQKTINDAREKFVDMEEGEDPKPKLYPIKDRPGDFRTEINDPEKAVAFSRVVADANKDTFEVNLHRIKISELSEEIRANKVNPVDAGVLLGYIFVQTDEQKKKTGPAKEEDLDIEVEFPESTE